MANQWTGRTADDLVGDDAFRALCAETNPATGTLYRFAELTRLLVARGENVTAATVGRAGKRVRAGEGKPTPKQAANDPSVGKWTETATGAVCESGLSSRPIPLDELIALFKIDTTRWEATGFTANTWGVGAKGPDGKIVTSPLYQSKATFKPIAGVSALNEIRDAIIADMAAHAPRYDRTPSGKGGAPKASSRARTAGSGYLLEVSAFDLHIAKLAHAEETGGASYDSRIACDIFRAVICDALAKAAPFAPERILFPVGNDLLHVDGPTGATTSGTPQDADTRYPKMFRRAYQLMIEAIDALCAVAPVDVVIVPGNHDRSSCFLLGEVLAAWYRHSPDVTVDNAPTLRKYVRWGTSLIGYTHGSEERHADLPLIMANERPRDWAETTHHEWHLGHRHTRRETKYTSGDTHNGVTVRILPSLTPPDFWHAMKGFVSSPRAMESYLWHKEDGYAAHFSSNYRSQRRAA